MRERFKLERRLRESRYEKASQIGVAILEGVGIGKSDRVIVGLDEVNLIWPRYLDRLRERAQAAERWPADESQAVQNRLNLVADRVDGAASRMADDR